MTEKSMWISKINLHMLDVMYPLKFENKDYGTFEEQIKNNRHQKYFKKKRNTEYWKSIAFFENGEFDNICANIGYDAGHIEKTINYLQRALTILKTENI